MSNYDFFMIQCTCGEKFSVQTKLTGNELRTFKIGDNVGFENHNLDFVNLQLKSVCPSCHKPPIILIRNGVIMGIGVEDVATHVEGAFGSVMMTGHVIPEMSRQNAKV